MRMNGDQEEQAGKLRVFLTVWLRPLFPSGEARSLSDDPPSLRAACLLRRDAAYPAL